MSRWQASGMALTLLLVAGCTGPDPALTQRVEVVTWPELEAILNSEAWMPISRSAESGDVAGVKANLEDPNFVAAVEQFAAAPIPSKFASPAREEAKKKVVELHQALIEKGKGGASPTEVKDLIAQLAEANGKLTDPNLK